MEKLLTVSDLTVSLPLADGSSVDLVESVDLSVGAGERVALVGESGSGKSLTARAVMGLDRGMTVSGSIRFKGRELVGLSERELRRVRGSGIGMVFQDPLGALNPLMRIGDQIVEPLRGERISRRAAHDKARRTLEELGVADAANRMRAYPHQFSGGMRQRVVIAMALVAEPELLIADEPTTALDVRVQAQVLNLLSEVAAARDLAVLFITHDVGVVGEFAHRVDVMYSGNTVERASVDDFFRRPSHPYTRGLLSAVPRLTTSERLISMKGSPPAPTARPTGCVFATRCAFATDRCREDRPVLREAAVPGAFVACHYSPSAGKEAA
jgi:oligopeptide/dipeptide ABC transporter ATP-binding protein